MSTEMFNKPPVRDFLYFSVMIGNSSWMTYLVYLYSNGLLA